MQVSLSLERPERNRTRLTFPSVEYRESRDSCLTGKKLQRDTLEGRSNLHAWKKEQKKNYLCNCSFQQVNESVSEWMKIAWRRAKERQRERRGHLSSRKGEIRWFISRSQQMSPRFIDVGPLSNSLLYGRAMHVRKPEFWSSNCASLISSCRSNEQAVKFIRFRNAKNTRNFVHSIIRWYITIILPDYDCLVVSIKYFSSPCPSNFTRKTLCVCHLRRYKRTQWNSPRRTNLYVLYIGDGTPSSFSRFSRTILVLDSIWRLKIFFPRVFVPPPRRPRLRSAFRGVITRRARPLPPLALSVPRDRNTLLFYKDARRACERTSERARACNTTKTCREKSRTRPPSRLDNGNAETSRGNVTMIEARPPREIYLAISRGLHERAPPSRFPAAPIRDRSWYFIRRNFYYKELHTLHILVL